MAVKSFVCNRKFTNIDSRDLHDSMHMVINDPDMFGFMIKDGKCVTSTQFEDEN